MNNKDYRMVIGRPSPWTLPEVLRTLFIFSGARCNNVDSLVDSTLGSLENPGSVAGTSEPQAILRYLADQGANILAGAAGPLATRRDVQLILIAVELQRGIQTFGHSLASFMSEVQTTEAFLQDSLEWGVARFRELGLVLPASAKLFIVDNYPEPFARMTGAAMVPDRTDCSRYGIDPGIYFRREKLSPLPSAITLFHELTHLVVSQNDDSLLARGLEEGIAEFLAFNVLAPERLNPQAVQSLFISKRLRFSGHAQRLRLYMDYFRQANWLYSTYGMSGLLELVRSGRRAIKKAEIALSNGKIDHLNLPRSAPSQSVANRGSVLASLFPENEVVVPEAFYYVLRYHNPALPALSHDLEASALSHIEKDIFGALLGPDGSIEFEDFDSLARSRAFRYLLDPRD